MVHHASGSSLVDPGASWLMEDVAGLTCAILAGPEEDIKPLLEQLKAENVFVRELDTRGLAFHSPVLQPHLGELKKGEPSFADCQDAHGAECILLGMTRYRPRMQMHESHGTAWHVHTSGSATRREVESMHSMQHWIRWCLSQRQGPPHGCPPHTLWMMRAKRPSTALEATRWGFISFSPAK